MKALFEAIQAGDLSQTQALVSADPLIVNAPDENGVSPLIFAKYRRQDAIADLLEARGAAIDIFAAAMLGRVSRIEELTSANRSLVSVLSADGWTPLHLAGFFGHKDAAQTLLSKGAPVDARSTNAMKNTPLHAAAAGRHSELVKLLAAHGANMDARQHGGWSALHGAAQNGDVEMARILIEAGADVHARAENQQRPIDLALTQGKQAMVDFLESNGASL